MSPHQSRFVTACQQLLALAVVLAVLTPAAGVVTLDVVGSAPDGSHTGAALAAAGRHDGVRRAGPAALSGADRCGRGPRAGRAAHQVAGRGRSQCADHGRRTPHPVRPGLSTLTSTPQRVAGFGLGGYHLAG